MRDDIHKSAPVGRFWQSLMKHCAREADHKERAAKSAFRAITSDCQKELSPKFLASIAQLLAQAQGTLFGGAVDEIRSAQGRDNTHVLEKEVVGHLRRREAFGQDPAIAIEGALADAIKGRLDSNLVAMKGHWKKHGARGADVPIAVAKKVIAGVPVAQLVKDILSGQSNLKNKNDSRQGVDLDEDLL
jgi:hypothetical protein